MESDALILFLALAIVLVVASVALVLWITARILYQATGLERMTQRFRAPAEPAGLRFGNQTVAVGAIRFRRCATAVVTPAGFYLKPWTILPALLIPWTEIHALRQTAVYRKPAVELSIGSPAAHIAIFPDLYAALAPHLPRET